MTSEKTSGFSTPVKLKTMTSEEIRSRKRPQREFRALRRIAERQAVGDDSGIDFSDIPPLTDEQLQKMIPLRDFLRIRKAGTGR
jgi:hypothetical protein